MFFHICSGVIISKEYILTAGHCIEDIEHYIDLHIVSGTVDVTYTITNDEILKADPRIPKPGKMFRDAKDWKIHPDFSVVTFVNDIAIIRVRVPFDFVIESVDIAPMLEKSSQVPKVRDVCSIAGWGQVKSRLNKVHFIRDRMEKRWRGSPTLKATNVSVWNLQKCIKSHRRNNLPDFLKKAKLPPYKVTWKNICAVGPGKDACTVRFTHSIKIVS